MARQMKDSGVEWIGEIPDNWSVFKTLWLLDMPITDGPHETPLLYDEGIPFISAEAVSCGCGGIDFSHKRGYISREYYVECCKKYTPKLHDIYMIKSGATTGRVSMVDTEEDFAIWSPLAVFRANPKKIAPRYLFYSLQADYYQNQISLSWSFGTQQNIGMRVLEQLKLAVPVIEEQQKIVADLDNKCSEIDKVVEQTRATIEEYKKLKQAIITEAVTKGVRGPRPMKPSGVEWIGDIPEEWDKVALKYLCRMNAGDSLSSLDILPAGEYPVYGGNGVRGFYSLSNCKGPVILIGRQGALCGNVHLVDEEFWSTEHAVITRFSADIFMRYGYYLLIAMNLGQYVSPSAAQPGLSVSKISSITAVIPHIIEQQEIATYLDTKCTEIDRIIEKKEQLIEELGSYKKSLIYEYVTGKKEVTA